MLPAEIPQPLPENLPRHEPYGEKPNGLYLCFLSAIVVASRARPAFIMWQSGWKTMQVLRNGEIHYDELPNRVFACYGPIPAIKIVNGEAVVV